MTRDLRRLVDTQFDLVVIGGGIYGTTAAWDATQRGLSVALVERADFGSGTSLNSAKTVHGGVRALQSANLGDMRQFVTERRALSRIVPHLVHPLPFVIPTYRRPSRNRWLMRGYFAAYDLLSRERNRGLDPTRQLPASRLLSREECLALSPSLDPAGVTGGIEWFDCQMYNSDRVNLSFLLSATQAGAIAANYAEVTGLLRDGNRVTGVQVTDQLGGERLDVQAKTVLNCGGPWAPGLLRSLAPDVSDSSLPTPLSGAMNLVTAKPLAGSHACGGWADGRLLFIAPWRGHAIVGTGHHGIDADGGARTAQRPQVEEFLSQANRAFPRARLGMDDIRLIHWGLLPAAPGAGRHDALLKASVVADHRSDGIQGLISVLGVRYTTARDTARQAIDTVFALRDEPVPVCRTHETPLVGGDVSDLESFMREAEREDTTGVSRETGHRLARSYGSRYDDVLGVLRETPDAATPLGTGCQVTRAEVRYAVRHEMAVKLSDAVLRRTEAGSAGHPGAEALHQAAAVMGSELGWSETRRTSEINEVETVYAVPGRPGPVPPGGTPQSED